MEVGAIGDSMHEHAKDGPRGRGHHNGRGPGRRMRRGRMFRQRHHTNDRVVQVEVVKPTVPTEEELDFLDNYAREVLDDLKVLRERVDQLK